MDWGRLLQQMDDALNDDDLRTLCFELEVDYDNLAGDTKRGKARELILELRRQGQVATLIDELSEMRSHVSWERPAAPQVRAHEAPAAANTARARPAMGGDSIGHYRAGAATLGCLVVDRKPPRSVYVLCDLSGLCPTGASRRVGDPILQPGKADGGDLSTDVLATLARWATLRDDPLAAADNLSVAIAQVSSLEEVSPAIRGRGFVQGVRQAQPGMSVSGVGRTSGDVSGSVQQTDATIDLPWPIDQVDDPASTGGADGRVSVLFSELIATSPMMTAGDSGMILLDGDNYALGLGFATSGKASFFIPIGKVLDTLNVDLVTEAVWQGLKE